MNGLLSSSKIEQQSDYLVFRLSKAAAGKGKGMRSGGGGGGGWKGVLLTNLTKREKTPIVFCYDLLEKQWIDVL